VAPPPIHAGEPPRSGTCVFARTYPSRIDRKQAIIDEVAAVLVERHWVTGEDLHWLNLCLDEVVVNAMLHGNEGDPDLDMGIALYEDGGRWVLIVTDQGEGFAADTLPDLDDPQSLLLEHGRGIRIMCEWLDELSYYRGGAAAVLIRRIAAPGAT
jgi:serine/threonine-protein kinase RsbW